MKSPLNDRVSYALADIMNEILFIVIVLCALVIAFNLFVLESGNFGLAEANAMFDLSSYLGLTFTYCFLSDAVTTDLFGIGTAFYDSPWYRLAPKQQHLLRFAIERTQWEVRLRGLRMVDCALATFSSVRE